MPSEHPTPLLPDAVLSDHPSLAQGNKICGSCDGPTSVDPLAAGTTTILISIDGASPDDQAVYCATCRSRLAIPRVPIQDQLEREVRRLSWQRPGPLRVDTELGRERMQRHSAQEQRSAIDTSLVDLQKSSTKSPCLTVAAAAPPPSASIQRSRSNEASTASSVHSPLSPAHASSSLLQPSSKKAQSSKSSRASHTSNDTLLDPFVDITRLRIRPRGYHCLYPGATFSGLQKSGKSSYDVTVTIVDVDVTASFLCGYLCIRGLTDDWPEMTTYFDAEIIGSRYGFITQKWGATENEDLMHWNKFPPFRHAKHELTGPSQTMPDRDRGAVFMRWKERFLVPDHRVQDISGASFAGFYYVCVDFNPQSLAQARSPVMQRGPLESESVSPPKQEPAPRARAPVAASSMSRRSSSFAGSRGTATMSGFYYHQNSEPYQQLSLQHVPENSSSCFEFR